MSTQPPSMPLSDSDYRRLLELRTGLRRFLKWSGDRARASGLTPTQHQLLLAIRGHPESQDPTVSDLAEQLQLRHHSTVELIDRAERDGLVTRETDPTDARVVRLHLTSEGNTKLATLSEQHVDELNRLAPRMRELWAGLE
ncbi:MAG: MarR family transcriptional regulator [Acidimicrobiia bacterium]|nr:MarR family transcriptional regulator [Acidimicrobiia bacterium]